MPSQHNIGGRPHRIDTRSAQGVNNLESNATPAEFEGWEMKAKSILVRSRVEVRDLLDWAKVQAQPITRADEEAKLDINLDVTQVSDLVFGALGHMLSDTLNGSRGRQSGDGRGLKL